MTGFVSAQNIKDKPVRKWNYWDFKKQYSINDTSILIVDLFFEKKEESAYSQMVFLPISSSLLLLNGPLGMGLMAVSTPFFINGVITLIKYRKKKLYFVLEDYQDDRTLPNWVRRKVSKRLEKIEEIESY
jgi:hypothetical protein